MVLPNTALFSELVKVLLEICRGLSPLRRVEIDVRLKPLLLFERDSSSDLGYSHALL